MVRRSFLKGLSLASLIFGLPARAQAASATSMKEIDEMQKNWKALLADKADIATSAEPLKRTNAEWKKLLSPAAYDVLREEGTERAGTSPLNAEKRPGVFVCAGCKPAAVHLGDEVRKRHRLAELLHDHTGAFATRKTTNSFIHAPNTTARAAAVITVTSSTTARRRPASAGATTAWRCASFQRPARPEDRIIPEGSRRHGIRGTVRGGRRDIGALPANGCLRH